VRKRKKTNKGVGNVKVAAARKHTHTHKSTVVRHPSQPHKQGNQAANLPSHQGEAYSNIGSPQPQRMVKTVVPTAQPSSCDLVEAVVKASSPTVTDVMSSANMAS